MLRSELVRAISEIYPLLQIADEALRNYLGREEVRPNRTAIILATYHRLRSAEVAFGAPEQAIIKMWDLNILFTDEFWTALLEEEPERSRGNIHGAFSSV